MLEKIPEQEIWFQLKYKDKVYNINLYEVISAIKFADDVKWIPQLSKEWWDKLLEMYPEFNEEPNYNKKEDIIYLTGDVVELEEYNYADEEKFYFNTSIQSDDAVLGLHQILEMFYFAEAEKYVPTIGYVFWYHISKIYRAYFNAGYEEVLCVNLKLQKVGKSSI